MVGSQLAASFESAAQVIQAVCADDSIRTTVGLAAQKAAQAFQNGNKLIFCGNGGSACDAIHAAEELTGRFRKNRVPLPALAITDPGHLTCVANDFGYDAVFSRFVEAHGKPGDLLVVLTTSGQSPNVLNAVAVAKQKQLTVVAFLGKDGGPLKGQSDLEFLVPFFQTERIQEAHMMLLHIWIEGIERILFPDLY